LSTAYHEFLYLKTSAKKQEQVRAHTREGKPVQAYTREGEEDSPLRKKQRRELGMWTTWREGGKRPEDLKPLLKSFEPMIQLKAGVYKRGNLRIPPSAIDLEFKKQFLAALEHYDPEKGSLGTYVYRYLDKARRFITNHQNLGRIPENRIYKTQEYKNALEHLDEALGKPPTHEELSKLLGWSPREVARMASEIRADIPTSTFEEDPNSREPSRAEEVLRLIQYELSPEELQVFRHTFEIQGADKLSPGEIAKKLKMSPSKVSRIRKRLAEKIDRYLR